MVRGRPSSHAPSEQLINGLEAITDSLELAAIRKARIREELDSVEDLEDLGTIAEAAAQSNKEWSDSASAVLENSTVVESHHDRIRERVTPPTWLRSTLEADVAQQSALYRATPGGKRNPWASMSSCGRALELERAAPCTRADCISAAAQKRWVDSLRLSQAVHSLDLAAPSWQVDFAQYSSSLRMHTTEQKEMSLERRRAPRFSAKELYGFSLAPSSEVSSTTTAPEDWDIYSYCLHPAPSTDTTTHNSTNPHPYPLSPPDTSLVPPAKAHPPAATFKTLQTPILSYPSIPPSPPPPFPCGNTYLKIIFTLHPRKSQTQPQPPMNHTICAGPMIAKNSLHATNVNRLRQPLHPTKLPMEPKTPSISKPSAQLSTSDAPRSP
ncbi:MAG: hypothetical protein Q9184_005312 [Pyrenodesmia sp. 2 TL-2023]